MNKEADIDEGNVDLDKEYKMRRAKAVSELVSRGSEYLVEGSEGLNKLSPKMLMILKNIKDAKGLIFIYSNFRSMEGVGIFARVLEANGYTQNMVQMMINQNMVYIQDKKTKMKEQD